jgi:hypothetical protein
LLQTQLFDLQDKYPRSITEGRCHRFKNYFINTYVEGYFLKIMWNHFETIEVRTNNNVEGDNLKMKCYCGAANPNMDKAVKLLKTFETTKEATYKNAKKSTAKLSYKRPEDRDTKFKQLKDLLKVGTISLEVYINKILDIHKFEPKKKYVEELVDTDESDSTSVDEDTDDEESESHHTDGEEDDEEIVTNEILS